MLNRLKAYLQQLSAEGIALAFSGGVDSSLLLALLAEIKHKKDFNLAVLTMHSALQSPDEINEAKLFAANYGLENKVFTFNPFSLPEVRHNRTNRCYCCKKAIFSLFADYARKQNIKYLIDGTNADDLNVYRPGRQALKELGVISPLAELGISKAQIRALSADMGLATASKPAVPCLATRFEYNTLLNDEKIKRVFQGEEFIKKLFPESKNVRLRIHSNLARIELSAETIPLAAQKYQEISSFLKTLGFDYITMDLEGFRSGSLDISLKQNL